ncbi:hypothetical protein HG535_0C04420 [Zygotorulaspora mrakii]|uniref:PH-response regulator protein palI/RIM9 n=1 Tax=Zygotorulaspora mrakii TaxID=42260 RepID=A0A7H9B0D1_ZYGMR|nr:uncharacterized protein HG535_0C04420 [Zygotorulaspora mrakii]QLG72088.1 hypothetical protein HG535_0C04420 [Zygotorulaspora mrakii]
MLPRTRAIFSTLLVLQFAAVAFFIICSVTAPVFRQIGLSKHNDVTYGVFGYCRNERCTTPSATYSPVGADTGDRDGGWRMSSRARTSLGRILIITPVAAGLNFLSMVSVLIAFLTCLISGSSSAVLFTINIVMATISFLASALVCVIVFLLFYPHITWCTWLLIPGAVLPLVVIPLIFVAHSDAKDDSIDSDDEELRGIVEQDAVDESQFDSPNKNVNFYQEMTGENTLNSLSEKPLVLPSYGYDNLHKQDAVFKVNTGTTDQSTMSKEKMDSSAYEMDDANSHTAYSAINGSQQQQNKPYSTSLSLASSEYSDKNHQTVSQQRLQQKDPHGVLKDIIHDSFSNTDLTNGRARSGSDNESDFTSISQRAPQQEYFAHAHVPSTMAQPSANQQQRLTQLNRSAGPDSSDLQQNNSNFIQQPNFVQHPQRRMYPQANKFAHQNYPPVQQFNSPRQYNNYANTPQNNFHNAQPVGFGPTPASGAHYKPAYKKRMNAKNMPPASSFTGPNPYGFR